MPSFKDLPNEIIEDIVSTLDLENLRNLRLTSKDLAFRASGRHFESYFRRKHVDLTASALRDLVEQTKPGRPGCCLEDLVLVGVVNNRNWLTRQIKDPTDGVPDHKPVDAKDQEKAQEDLNILTQRQMDYERMHESGTDVQLLSEAFGNLKILNHNRRPLSISLEVVVYRVDAEQRLPPAEGGSWMLIWQLAADTFHTTIRALAASQLPVEKLDIYSSQQRCSLACTELSAVDVDTECLAASLAPLKTLSISFSDRIFNLTKEDLGITGDSADEVDWQDPVHDDYRPDEEMAAEICDESNFVGLARLLQHCNGLESLELHHYELDMGGYMEEDLHRDTFLRRIIEMAQFPHLKRCTLRGLRTTDVDLLAFLKQTAPNIRQLQMHMVRLLSGKLKPIFDYCTDDKFGMERILFDELYEFREHRRRYVSRWLSLIRFDCSCGDILDRVGPEGIAGHLQWITEPRQGYGPP